MTENRPRSSDRKFALVAPIVIVMVAVIVLIVLLVKPQPHPAPVLAPQPNPPPAVIGPPPVVTPATVSRSDLIAGAAAASSAYAAGEAPPTKAGPQVGRPFEISIAFGCTGPVTDPGSAQAYYQYDPKKQALRLVARPSIWTDLPLIRAMSVSKPAETVEGFWMPRPWTNSETCPPPRDAPPPATPTPFAAPTLGLAMVYGPESSRVDQRGDRPYEFLVKLAKPDAPILSRTFRLKLEGRIASFSDGASVRCWSESNDHRPVCLYAVDIDRVAFEDNQGAVLTEWLR